MRSMAVLLMLAGCSGPSNRLWIAAGDGGNGLRLDDREPHPF